MDTKMIGSKITKGRKNINISQAELAQRLFISPQAVGKWERGESVPDILTFNRLAEILGVDLNYFSENYESTEITSAGATDKRPAEAPTEGHNKLSWDMSRGNWLDADFSGLKNLHEKFSSSNMLRCKFIGSDMSGLLLKGNNVNTCDFSDCDFSNSQIQNSYLSANIFKDCSLKGTEFSGSYISGCDLSGADLTGAVIRNGGIEKCTMTNAVLNRTSFNAVGLADIVFTGVMDDCYFENCAFTRVTFQNATITNTFFKGRGLKKIKLVDCKVDRITYAFLQNGKVDMSGVTLLE
jgi:uncharacterized protein YjbI with pentapeptide repeats